jgi:hypothetical protein
LGFYSTKGSPITKWTFSKVASLQRSLPGKILVNHCCHVVLTPKLLVSCFKKNNYFYGSCSSYLS